MDENRSESGALTPTDLPSSPSSVGVVATTTMMTTTSTNNNNSNTATSTTTPTAEMSQRQDLQELKDELRRLQDSNNTLQLSASAFEHTKTALEEERCSHDKTRLELATVSAQLSSKEKESGDARSLVDAANRETEQARSEVKESIAKLDALQKGTADKDHEMCQLKEELEAQSQQKIALEKELAATNVLLNDKQKEVETAQKEAEEALVKLKTLETKQNEELEAQRQQHQCERASLEQEIARLSDLVTTLKASHENELSQVRDVNSILLTAQQRQREVEADLKKRCEEVTSLQSILSQKDTKISTLENDVALLRSTAEETMALVKRQREDAEEREKEKVKRVCLTPVTTMSQNRRRRVFSLSGFGDISSLGNAYATLGALRAHCHDVDVLISVAPDDVVPEHVTHVLVPNDNARSTMKLLTALVKGRWVVPMVYLTECVQQKQWLDERDFGVIYDAPPLEGKQCYLNVGARYQEIAAKVVECGGGTIAASTLKADVNISNWAAFTRDLVKGKFRVE
eukprot:PhM_4_TR15866/c0_g2_i1/m.28034